MIHASRAIGTAVVTGFVFVGGALPDDAAAHAYLVKSSPSHRAVLARPPARVDLWFKSAWSCVLHAVGGRVERRAR